MDKNSSYAYVVERSPASNGARRFVCQNGTTSEASKATRFSEEYAKATTREFRRAGDVLASYWVVAA